MATIRKRGSSYHVQIRRQGYRPITKTFSDRQNALIWARKVESEVEREIYIDNSTAKQTKLETVLDRYLSTILISKRAGETEKPRIRLLKQSLGFHCLASLRPHHIARYRDERLQSVKPATVKRELGLLSRVLNTAIKDWGIPLPQGNPIKQTRLPKVSNKRERRLQGNEETRLLDALRFTPEVQRIVKFALETALRRSEIISMDWKHVDLERRTVHIPRTKTDTPRTIPLSPKAWEILTQLQEETEEGHGPVWNTAPRSVTQAFKRACTRAELSNLTFHDLRHEV